MAKRKTHRRRHRRRASKGQDNFMKLIHRLRKLKAPQRQQAMKVANDKFIRDLCTRVKTLRKAKGIQPSLRKKLKRHVKTLRKLTNSKTALKTKRKMLSQRGGFLPLLLAALPALGSILGGVISRV